MILEFTEKDLEDIDKLLSQKDIPLVRRPFKALEILGISCTFDHPIFKKINNWYEKRYGREMLLNWKIGEKPFKLRGHIYYIRFPVIFGRVEVDILECIENLTPDMARSLTPEEIEIIKENACLGYEAYRAIDGVSSLHEDAQELVDMGVKDVHASVSTLKENKDPQLPIFHAHAASEKFLKAFLVQSGEKKEDVKKLGHNLQDILKKCIQIDRTFRSICNHVNVLHLPNMNIRYNKTAHTQEDAISAIDATLLICKFVANIWNPEYTNPTRFVQ